MWTLEGSGVQISAGGQLPEAVELVPGDPWLRALLLHYTHKSGPRHASLLECGTAVCGSPGLWHSIFAPRYAQRCPSYHP